MTVEKPLPEESLSGEKEWTLCGAFPWMEGEWTLRWGLSWKEGLQLLLEEQLWGVKGRPWLIWAEPLPAARRFWEQSGRQQAQRFHFWLGRREILQGVEQYGLEVP